MASPPRAKLGKLPAADVARGAVGPGSRHVADALTANPELAIDIIDSLIAEGRRPDPDDDMLDTHTFMLGAALEGVRYGVEAGHRDAKAFADKVRRHLIAVAASGSVQPGLMLLLVNQLVAAKLDVGAELQAVVLRMMEEKAADAPAENLRDAAADLRELASMLDGNPFDIHGHLTELAGALPEAMHAKMALSLLDAAESGLAHAALGFLLSPSAEVRTAVGQALAEAAGTKTAAATLPDAPVLLRRLIALRNWLPGAERAAVDAAIKGLRQNGVACAPWAKPGKIEAYATGFDGSGMQSVFLIVKEGRKHAIAALIGRLGDTRPGGVRDAYVRHGATKREVDDMLRSGDMMGGLAPVEMEFVTSALGHYLAGHAASGSLPPFGLLAIAECAGLTALTPVPIGAETIVARLCAEIEPECLTPAMVGTVLAESADWPEHYELLQSWFEEGDDITALLGGKRLTKAKKVAAVLDGPLTRNRRRWAELLAWMAMFTKAITDAEGPWREFAVLARELLSDRPIADIGLMRRLAEQTVEADADGRR